MVVVGTGLFLAGRRDGPRFSSSSGRCPFLYVVGTLAIFTGCREGALFSVPSGGCLVFGLAPFLVSARFYSMRWDGSGFLEGPVWLVWPGPALLLNSSRVSANSGSVHGRWMPAAWTSLSLDLGVYVSGSRSPRTCSWSLAGRTSLGTCRSSRGGW